MATKTLGWPTLYRQNNTGKIQQWRVYVEGNKVVTVYGLVDGKHQTTTDVIKAGKNLGKANATTAETQAEAQASQEFEAKIKEGYVQDIAKARTVKNALAAVEPMLAFPIEKKEKYVKFPALAQPKLDGLRCIAIIAQGKARLFSRTQKEYTTVPHIVKELETLYADATIILDGEIYSHQFKDDFNSITHLAKRDDVHEDSTALEYHVYDVVGPGGFRDRYNVRVGKYVRAVNTVDVFSREDLEEYQATCVENGYEGAMLRNPTGEYENKRSSNLLKVKTFQDMECKILGVEEGAGKLMGAVGAFVMETDKGVGFKAKPMGTLALSQEYWKNRKALIGRYGTVKFQSLTPDFVPRFPVFKALRDGKE